MKKVVLKKIEDEFYGGSQSVYYKGIFSLNEFKIKISLRRDSYDQQSYARVHVWSKEKLEWNFLDSIPYSKMNCVVSDSTSIWRNFHLVHESKMTIDIRTLKNKAKQILS